MPSQFVRQPWETWVVVALGLWSLNLLYGSALDLQIFFRSDIVTNQEQFAEALLRLAGLILLDLGALVLFCKRRFALLLVIVGFLLYLAPWAYHYYELSASQPQPHLVWHMIKTYPKLTWQWLPLPFGMLVFTGLAIHRLSANPTVDSDAQQAARGSP
jgi:hypothetical protein